MWSIAAIVLIGVVFAIIEAPRLQKRKKKKDLWVFFILLLLGISLNSMENLGVSFPSPLNAITTLVEPFDKWISELLK